MRKLLEVTVSDNGEMIVNADNQYLVEKGFNKPKNAEPIFRKAIEAFTKKLWSEKDSSASIIMRILSMAEICSSLQPYQDAEEFWSTMMFSFLPRFDKYSCELKAKYGYNPKNMVRPVSYVDPDFDILELPVGTGPSIKKQDAKKYS